MELLDTVIIVGMKNLCLSTICTGIPGFQHLAAIYHVLIKDGVIRKTIQFIKDFYANYVFGAKNYVPAVKKHCTAKLQKQLKDNYEYDSEGYAIWNFRTGMQDGPSDISKVTSVTALGNGLYKVNFIDMGIKGNRTLKIIDVNGTLKFDAIK